MQINPAIVAAEADYRPDLVMVDERSIASSPRPERLGAMGSVLGASPIASDPAHYIPYFIAMVSQNFMFWDLDTDGKFERYGRNGLIGAHAMQDGFHAQWLMLHLQEAGSVASVAELMRSRVASEGVHHLFENIPQPQARQDILTEVLDARKLINIANLVRHKLLTDHSLSWREAQMLAEIFPRSYADRYLKKAQLTLMFIAAEWNAANPQEPCKLDVTLAADYQCPKVLRRRGHLVYGPEVDYLVSKQELILEDSIVERAIRSATVKAGLKLAEHYGCADEELDFEVWASRNLAKEDLFHLTRTTNY